ncbi:hypothetical protein [Aeoliella mucimassa]|uniref:HEAT repeat domain-containing protein n=1 Tax=Aeoliella mucimassa TaxID=2527972 RepID=A0A518AKC3_9BACT|nr:hypothetical protein [Aeoliella mucimassa]QDU55181.1 hypothetical protein Pan181_13670 [Aeoliella mucimassa]
MKQLLSQLKTFDGKHAEPLERLAADTPATKANIQKLLALAEHEQESIRVGATWVLKRWADDGQEYEPAVVAMLIERLRDEDTWAAKLHLLQMLVECDLPKASCRSLATRAKNLAASENKFLRAWATSVAVQVAEQHAAYRPTACKLVEKARSDSAASVKARVRQLEKKHAWLRESA